MNVKNAPSQPPVRRPFDSLWWAKRGGLILAGLIILVFGTELTLATQRRRDIALTVNVQSAQAAQIALTVGPTATGIPGEPSPTPTPVPAVLPLAPADRLSVLVKWMYHIGPRFPHTTIFASVTINSRVVSTGEVLIDCGTAVFDCTGQQPVTLAYTVPDTGSGASTVDWPSGDYLLTVTRSDGGLTPFEIAHYSFHVQ